MSRKVTVYSTLGNNKQVVETTANTWGELQRDLNNAGVSYSGMKAVIGQTQVTLESAQAAISEGDFTLFLMPVKVKSGWELDNDDEDNDWDNDDDEIPVDPKTQAILKVQQAMELLKDAINLISTTVEPQDEETRKLQQEAEELQRNLDLFN